MRIPHRQFPRKVDNPACGPKHRGDRETFRTSEAMWRKLAEEAFPPRHALNPQRSALAPSTRRSSGQAVVVQCLVLPRRGPALRAAQSAYALSDGLHIGCACALPVPRHFLATWWRPSTFSAASPSTHAGLRCHWCGLSLACSTARACLSRAAPRAWALARPSLTTWRAGGANVCDGLQPRTLYARLFLETSTAHASSPVTPRRAQPSRAAEPHASLVSAALSHLQTRVGAVSPCAPSVRQRGKTFRIQRTFSFRMCACVDLDSSCRHDAHAHKLHGLSASCRNRGTACPYGWSALLFY